MSGSQSVGEFAKRQVSVFGRTRMPLRRERGPLRVVDERAIVHEKASRKSRILQRIVRIIGKPILRFLPFNDRTITLIQRLDVLSQRRPRSARIVRREYRLGGVRVEQMSALDGQTKDLTVLYFHGGGFFSGSIDTHRRLCERLVFGTGGTVISVDYVQLPRGAVADSVNDAITAYEALLEASEHPDQIVVAGDSAGGYLAMKVAELATRRGITVPAAIVGFSPLLSLDPDRVDKGIERVSRMNDAYLPLRRVGHVRTRWLPEEGRIEGCESPLEAAGYITSPTFMVAVEDEMLRPEVEAMALRLAARGVEVETHLWRGQVHAFPVLADVLPESLEAIALASRFILGATAES